MNPKFTVYLAGEIHSPWREEIIQKSKDLDLPIEFLAPEKIHADSDDCGDKILGSETTGFWKDHKSANINSIRNANFLKKSDIVVVRFGEKYKQWNAAFDAGQAVALGKSLIVIHPEEFTHALKEVDARAQAVCIHNSQVTDILEYLCRN